MLRLRWMRGPEDHSGFGDRRASKVTKQGNAKINLSEKEMNDVAKTCARLVEFEEHAASLYLALARRFVDNKDLSWFWNDINAYAGLGAGRDP